MNTWLDKSVPSSVAVSKAASFRKVWGMPSSVTETSRMGGGAVGSKKIIILVSGLLGTLVKCAYIIWVQFLQQMNSYFTLMFFTCLRKRLGDPSTQNLQIYGDINFLIHHPPLELDCIWWVFITNNASRTSLYISLCVQPRFLEMNC